jgi:hypothetical protein
MENLLIDLLQQQFDKKNEIKHFWLASRYHLYSHLIHYWYPSSYLQTILELFRWLKMTKIVRLHFLFLHFPISCFFEIVSKTFCWLGMSYSSTEKQIHVIIQYRALPDKDINRYGFLIF